MNAPRPKRLQVVKRRLMPGDPVVGKDAVFLGSPEDVIVRLDRRTLEPVWKVDAEGFWIGSLVEEEFLTTGGRGLGGLRLAADGRVVWTTRSYLLGIRPWREYGIVVTDRIEFRSLRAGELGWAIDIPERLTAIHGVFGNRLVAQGESGVTRAINLESGEIVWERVLIAEVARRIGEPSSARAVFAAVSTIPDRLVAFNSGRSFAFSISDGSVLWVASLGAGDSLPTVSEGRILLTRDGRFLAIDEATGATVLETQHERLRPAYRKSKGTVYRGRVAFSHESGHLAVFDTATGELVSFYVDKTALWRTAEADGRLLVSTGNGELLVFDESIWGL